MCGRFVAFSSADEIADRLALTQISEGARLLPPNWNVAPTNTVPIITPNLELQTAQWGLPTNWSRPGAGIINARIETVAEKPAFAQAFAQRRCIVPVDGYYEWQRPGPGHSKAAKQPWYISGPTYQLYFAGIYSSDSSNNLTLAIITMPAAAEIADIHHRMPLSFGPQTFDQWLVGSPDDALATIQQADQQFIRYPVSSAVNYVRNNGPQLIEPIETAETSPKPELTLF